jgi:arsenate reductase
VLQELDVPADVVQYLKAPPDREALTRLVGILEDPVEDLVRKDARFQKLGLDPDDYVGNPQAVVDLLSREKALMQRPVLVKGDRAIIGRPKTRVADFVAG